ncbi:MAG TPA: hypothetical protein VNN21_05835 [Dehalococcoidia bacterium]|nr:hypothetical protein [Dehalococcoidia bacterium]
MTTNDNCDPVAYLRQLVAAGEHWYIAVLKTMARWDQAEEVVEERRYRYLIGGEAFDWLLLAERLVDVLDGTVTPAEREALIFHGHPPLEVSDEEFQALIGTPKYQAYLNYLYGVVVEEALQLAVEEEIAKEQHAHVWSGGAADGAGVFQRIYGKSQAELLAEFQKQRGLPQEGKLDYEELKEFTYWLFKYRVRSGEGERVASDTRKGLAALSRLEDAYRRRAFPEASTPEEQTMSKLGTPGHRARRRQIFADRDLD